MKHNFKNLNIWKKSVDLVQATYVLTKKFPSEEKFGLTSQLRRASVSVPSNIAEGCGRKGNKELKQFCFISIGSLCECETQVILANKLGYINSSELSKLTAEIEELRKMIYGFIKSIKNEI